MRVEPIKTEAENQAALARIEMLWDAKPDTSDGDELEVWIKAVEWYEEHVYPMGLSDPR